MHGETNFTDADSSGLSVYIHSGYVTDNKSMPLIINLSLIRMNHMPIIIRMNLKREPIPTSWLDTLNYLGSEVAVPECKRTRPTVCRIVASETFALYTSRFQY